MSVSARLFWSDGRFHDDELGGGIGPADLGIEVAVSLMKCRELTPSGYLVNYAVEMMRMTGRSGRFYDYIQDTRDHAYDDNVPTPHGIGEARQHRAVARLYRRAAEAGRTTPMLFAAAENTLAFAQQLEQYAASLTRRDRTSSVRNPLKHRYTLPEIKRSRRVDAQDMIEFLPRAGVFCFNGYDASPKQLGRLIAITLMRGDDEVTIGGITVTVNFVVQMLRDTGRYGIFTEDTWDDRFDGNVPQCLQSQK